MSQLKKLFAAKNGSGASTQLEATIEAVASNMRLSGRDSLVSAKGAGLALGLESFADDAVAASDLQMSIDSLTNVVAGLEADLTSAQREAAVMAGAITGDIGAFLRNSNMSNVPGAMAATGGIDRIAPALESYDEKENRAAAVYTVAYNLQAARQDAFGEAFYPTVVVAPDQQGYHIHLNLVNLINGVRRKATGELDNWNRHNIVNVIRNPGLINSTSTKIAPVYRDGYKQFFVDTALVAPITTDVNGEQVQTAPLAIGKVFDLIDLSQTDLQLDQGHMDETDSIDTDILLKSVVIKVGNDVLEFPTTHLPGAQFHYPVQGDQQRMDVRLETAALSVGPTTLNVAGAALDTLKPVVDGNLVVYIKTTVTGSVVRDKGDTELNASAVRIDKIIDQNGDVALPSSPAYAAIVALFNDAQVIGYRLDARRTNLNRRSIGQMLETRQDVQAYAVPLLSPFTVKRPQGLNDTTDASDLASLVTLTRAMASGKAVDELFDAADTLKALVQEGRRPLGDNLMVLGIARHLITAFYEEQEIKVDSTVQTRNSAELAANIQATLINVIRDMVFRAYQLSGYKAAADMLAGGESAKPVVIIGTDQTLARYLQVAGDLRTIGGGFEDVMIVDTQNERMHGKIFITFGVKGAADGIPHPLHFGNMAWKPEVTVVLPIHRNGANSKELTVQPAFRHITNLPILLEITVTGIPSTVDSRVPVVVTGSLNTTTTP
ncbi:putative major head protein [Ralstonia phage RP31]|uniref:Putative major head protein n=2 Tax=Ripduovirus RP12 TaxID=2560700 RepID=A0A1L7N0S4_9CAUD|nr:major head protein [Ralstonia phage RP12]BAW19068.1 putative major head protein [Ralstonia phage RP12]BAW19353.1 putative major head protein [Ralstonia phage RP31]